MSTKTPVKSSAVELDPTSDSFNPKSLTISQLVHILSKWDVDLPTKKEKKEIYVKLLTDNLSYIIKRSKKEKQMAEPKPLSLGSKRASTTVDTPSRAPLTDASNSDVVNSTNTGSNSSNTGNNLVSSTTSSASPALLRSPRRALSMKLADSQQVAKGPTSVKRPAANQEVQFDNQYTAAAPGTPTHFSSSNVFQSPGLCSVPKSNSNSARKVKQQPLFSSETAVVADKDGNIPINFSTSDQPSFDAIEEAEGGKSKPTSPIKTMKSKRRSSLGLQASSKSSDKIDSTSLSAAFEKHVSQPQETESKLSLQERLIKRNKAKQQAKKSIFARIALGLSMICTVLLSHYAIVDHPSLHYCTTSPSTGAFESNTDAVRFYSFLPSCVPCPPSAICSSRGITGCSGRDLILQYGWITKILPVRFLPFPLDQPSCQYDTARIMQQSKKARQVDHILKVLDHIVREYVGQAQCKNRKESPAFIFSKQHPFKVLGMPIIAAKSRLQKLVGKKWDEETFEEYWSLVIEAIAKGAAGAGEESLTQQQHTLSMVVEDQSQHRLLHSSSPPIQPLSCSVKKAIWSWMIEHSLTLILGSFTILAGVYAYFAYSTRVFETLVFNSLIDDVIVAIHAENENHAADPMLHPIPGLAISQLKDHFLPSTNQLYLPPAFMERPQPTTASQSTTKIPEESRESALDNQGRKIWFVSEPSRSRIWKRVYAAVGKNSNIRETTAHVKGEAHLVWKWVGSIALSPMKKRLRIS